MPALLLGLVGTLAPPVAVRIASAADGPDPAAGRSEEAAAPSGAPADEQQSNHADQLLEQTVDLMQAAQGRLASSQLDDETGRLQRQIEEHLARLLKLAEQQAALRPQIMPDEQRDESPASDSSATGGAGNQRSQSSRAGESSEQPRGGEDLTQDEVQRRKNLATAVWGHLPPRLRDRMHGAFSERFLPQYDELVRRYYEALATQGDGEP